VTRIIELISINRIHRSNGSMLIDDDVAAQCIWIMNEISSLNNIIDHIDIMTDDLYA